jgi:hypothetical protein
MQLSSTRVEPTHYTRTRVLLACCTHCYTVHSSCCTRTKTRSFLSFSGTLACLSAEPLPLPLPLPATIQFDSTVAVPEQTSRRIQCIATAIMVNLTHIHTLCTKVVILYYYIQVFSSALRDALCDRPFFILFSIAIVFLPLPAVPAWLLTA